MTSTMLRAIQGMKLRETFEASVFADEDTGKGGEAGADALCRPVMRLGLYFGDHAPRAWMMGLLKDQGLEGPDALKSKLNVPNTPLILRPWAVDSVVGDSVIGDLGLDDWWLNDSEFNDSGLSQSGVDDKGPHRQGLLDVIRAEPWVVLHQALCLGLCSTHRYDPGRPVIWTNGGLSRRVVCFSVGGFYQ